MVVDSSKVARFVAGFSFLSIFLSVLFISRTGIDLLDEGYYLIGYNREQPIYFQLSGFHFLTRLLPLSDNIVMARLYRILLLLLSGFVLAKALHKKIFMQEDYLTLLFLVLVGNFSSYMFAPQTISYNTYNLLFLELLTASYLYFREEFIRKENVIYLLLFSFVLGLLAFNKTTTAALMALAVTVDQFIYKRTKFWEWFKIVMVIGILSLVVFIAAMFWAYGMSLPYKIGLLLKADSPFQSQHVSMLFLVKQLFVSTLLQSKKFILFTIAYLLAYYLFKKYKSENSSILIFLFAVIAVGACYFYRKVYYDNFPGSEFFYSFILFYLIAWLLKFGSRPPGEKTDWHFIILCILMPLIGFWGSNLPPFLGLTQYLVFGVLIGFYFYRQLPIRFFLFFPLIISGFVLFNVLWQPYYNPPVFDQDRLIEVNGNKINVSESIYSINSEFLKTLPSIQRNIPLVNIGVPAGLLYINSLKNYYTVYFNEASFTVGYLKLISLEKLPDKFHVLIAKDAITQSAEIKTATEAFLNNSRITGYVVTQVFESAKYKLLLIEYKTNIVSERGTLH